MADAAFEKSTVTIPKIYLFIGIEYYDRIMMTESVDVGNAKLKETQFGWVLKGPMPASHASDEANMHVATLSTLRSDFSGG